MNRNVPHAKRHLPRPAEQPMRTLDESYKTRNGYVSKHGANSEGQNTRRARDTKIDLQSLDRCPPCNRED